jgi:hypothetical protein
MTVTSVSAPASITSRGNTAAPAALTVCVTVIGPSTTAPAGRELRANALGAGDDRVDGRRPEPFEVELADPAVAPDLFLGGGQLRGREPLGRGEPLLENGADQIWIEDADRVGGERRHGLNSSIRVVVIGT